MRKIQPQKWEDANNVNIFTDMLKSNMSRKDALARVKANNQIAKLLVSNGWQFSDSCHIIENGYTLSFRKPTGFNSSHPYAPYVHFQWYWDNCGGDDFMRGDMRTFFNYHPDYKCLGPVGHFEISDILEANLKDLYKYEMRVIWAMTAQTKFDNGIV